MKDLLYSEPYRFGFFQAVRLLERQAEGGREPVGKAVDPSREVVRFRSRPSLSFPASEVHALTPPPPGKEEERPPEMTVAFMSLTGPQGALPLPYTELLMERIQHKDRAAWDFFDLFFHRLVSLFYRAWEKYHFAIGYDRTGKDPFTEYAFDVIGMGTPAVQDRLAVPDQALLLYAGLIAQKPHSAWALGAVLRDYFGTPAEIVQFQGQWFPLEADSVSQLGSTRSSLGHDLVAGSNVFVSQSKFRVRFGPLTLRQFLSFLPVGDAFVPACDLTRYMAGLEFDFDVQLVLKKEEVPPVSLASDAPLLPMLGWTTWVTSHPPDDDVSDVVLPVNN